MRWRAGVIGAARLGLLLGVGLVVLAPSAEAHRDHFHGGGFVFFGGPVYRPYYPPPVYYAPPPVYYAPPPAYYPPPAYGYPPPGYYPPAGYAAPPDYGAYPPASVAYPPPEGG